MTARNSVSGPSISDDSLTPRSALFHCKDLLRAAGGPGAPTGPRLDSTSRGFKARRRSEPFVLSPELTASPACSPVDDENPKTLSGQHKSQSSLDTTAIGCESPQIHRGGTLLSGSVLGLHPAAGRDGVFREARRAQGQQGAGSLSRAAGGKMLAQRSTSFVGVAAVRGASYEEELEEKLGGVRVSAQLWHQRAMFERAKRKDAGEQLARQEQQYRGMLDELREREEQKYERLKNRARLLMKRCEHLRNDRQTFDKKLSVQTDLHAAEKRDLEVKLSSVTKELETARTEREHCFAALTAKTRSCDTWCTYYKTLFEVAVIRVKQLEIMLTENKKQKTKMATAREATNMSKSKSESCPSLLPSSERPQLSIFRTSLLQKQTSQSDKDVSKQIVDDSANKGTSSVDRLDRLLRGISQPLVRSINRRRSQGKSLPAESAEFRQRHAEKLQNAPSVPRRTNSDGTPEKKTSKPSSGAASLSNRHNGSLVFKVKSGLHATNESQGTADGASNSKSDRNAARASSLPRASAKPRRMVSLPRMDLLRKLQLGLGGGDKYKSDPTKLKAVAGTRHNEIAANLVIKTCDKSNKGTCRSELYGNNLSNKMQGEPEGEKKVNDSNLEHSAAAAAAAAMPNNCLCVLDDDDITCNSQACLLTSVENDDVRRVTSLSEAQQQSGFGRLRDRRNCLTDAPREAVVKAATQSKLDQLAQSIKSYLS